MTAAALAGACGGGTESEANELTGGNQQADSTVDEEEAVASESTQNEHQEELAIWESEFVTRFVVPVDGYRYVNEFDAPYENVAGMLESVDRATGANAFGALSLHSIVADDPSQNTARTGTGEGEVGYLNLIQLNTPILIGEDEDWSDVAIKLSLGTDRPYEMIDQLDLSGTTVFVFENSELPDSRFTHAWLDQGVMGFIDGADREPLERWLAAYLRVPKLAEGETVDLDARLNLVRGFRYSNVDPESFLESELSPLIDIPHSLHYVSDHATVIGMFAIAPSSHAPALEDWAERFADYSETDSIDVRRSTVEVLDGVSGDRVVRAYVWNDGTYAAVLNTNPDRDEQALAFIDAFVGT